jgi:hypothetical protein
LAVKTQKAHDFLAFAGVGYRGAPRLGLVQKGLLFAAEGQVSR